MLFQKNNNQEDFNSKELEEIRRNSLLIKAERHLKEISEIISKKNNDSKEEDILYPSKQLPIKI